MRQHFEDRFSTKMFKSVDLFENRDVKRAGIGHREKSEKLRKQINDNFLSNIVKTVSDDSADEDMIRKAIIFFALAF